MSLAVAERRPELSKRRRLPCRTAVVQRAPRWPLVSGPEGPRGCTAHETPRLPTLGGPERAGSAPGTCRPLGADGAPTSCFDPERSVLPTSTAACSGAPWRRARTRACRCARSSSDDRTAPRHGRRTVRSPRDHWPIPWWAWSPIPLPAPERPVRLRVWSATCLGRALGRGRTWLLAWRVARPSCSSSDHAGEPTRRRRQRPPGRSRQRRRLRPAGDRAGFRPHR